MENQDLSKQENNLRIFHTASIEQANKMKIEGVDPIIVRISPNEVAVLTKSQDVVKRILEGNNWSTGQEEPDESGYFEYIYTRLNEQELTEHLNDPSKYKGSS